MKHTCSYLQWNLSNDWNPVSIKYQIHKKIIKICTTLHLKKKKDWMNWSIFWTHLEPGFKIYSWKKPFWHSPWVKLEKVRGKLPNQQCQKWSNVTTTIYSLQAECLVDYFHISQIQVNRTSGIRNTKMIIWKLNFTRMKTLTNKIIKNKLNF